jgi:small neutral amino acid transporter SnatA (MarC family)
MFFFCCKLLNSQKKHGDFIYLFAALFSVLNSLAQSIFVGLTMDDDAKERSRISWTAINVFIILIILGEYVLLFLNKYRSTANCGGIVIATSGFSLPGNFNKKRGVNKKS